MPRRRRSWLGGLGRRATSRRLAGINLGWAGWATEAASPRLAEDGRGWARWAAWRLRHASPEMVLAGRAGPPEPPRHASPKTVLAITSTPDLMPRRIALRTYAAMSKRTLNEALGSVRCPCKGVRDQTGPPEPPGGKDTGRRPKENDTETCNPTETKKDPAPMGGPASADQTATREGNDRARSAPSSCCLRWRASRSCRSRHESVFLLPW